MNATGIKKIAFIVAGCICLALGTVGVVLPILPTTPFYAITRAAYNSGVLYSTSEAHEGYLMLSGEGVGRVRFWDGIKMISAEKKALGGFGNMKKFIKACFAEGSTIESRMRKVKRKFLRIEMPVGRRKAARRL